MRKRGKCWGVKIGDATLLLGNKNTMNKVKDLSVTMAGVWAMYGINIIALVNQFGGTTFDATCVESVGTNVGLLIANVVVHVGRMRKGDLTAGGFKK